MVEHDKTDTKLTIDLINRAREELSSNKVPQDCGMLAMHSDACGTVFIMGNGDILLANGEQPTSEQGKALMKEFFIR